MRLKPLFWIALVSAPLCAHAAKQPDYPIQPVPLTAVKVADSFWSPRFDTNRVRTVWYDFAKCEETGRIDNFAKAAGRIKGEFRGTPWDDSDVFKVIEGAAYVLAMQPDARLDKYLDDLIDNIAAAQEPDGYLYSARRLFAPDKMPSMSGPQRWSNLAASHELYNVGHLYEAAVAHHLATGKKTLLNVAIKNADFLCKTFGPAREQKPPGHQEIEIGLVKLYRLTGRSEYLQLAKFLLDIRGRSETHPLYGPNQQDHQPVTAQSEAVGHAVRAGYMYAGMADVAALTGEQSYVQAIDRIWDDVITGKLHLTGGIGARSDGEAFGKKYELPNRAYLETCAAIANAYWNHRMFLLHGDAKYLDVLERVIYNGFLSGVSISGDRFFYPNPLEADGNTAFNHGSKERAPWFGCSCCPVNVVRFIPGIAGYIYASRGDELFVNLFVGGNVKARVGNRDVMLTQRTHYPWDGTVKLNVDPEEASEFALTIRIPGWARGTPVPSDLYRYAPAEQNRPAALKVNGKAVTLQMVKGFAVIQRKWQKGDVVDLDLPMPVRRVFSHDAVEDNAGRVAIERGPIVYCAEGTDNDGKVLNSFLPDDASFTTLQRAELLNGVTLVQASAATRQRDATGNATSQAKRLTLIPYYAWNHRGPNEMAVWLARSEERAQIAPAPTLAGLSKPAASFINPRDTLEALNDQILPASSGDQTIPRFTWWGHLGTRDWVQYDLKSTATVTSVAVYWFDDTGSGQCRVPRSWRVLYKSGDQWKPVEATRDYAVKKDTFNVVNFAAISTSALRIEAELQPGFSGGILEWKVNDIQ